jgi:hypothetical protein
MALCYSSHNVPPKKLRGLLEMFDEAFYTEQGTNGGRLKRDCLTSRSMERSVTFTHRPGLDNLLRELTDTFAVRYEKTPTSEELARFEMLQSSIPHALLQNDVVFKYQSRLQALVEPNWLIDTFRRHLEDRDAWLAADKAKMQKIDAGEPITTTRKRNSDQARLDSNVPRMGKILKTDSNGT